LYGIKIKQVIFAFTGRSSSQVYPIKELVIKMKVFILLCLLTLAISENLEKIEKKGQTTPLLWYIIERLLNLSANVNELKNKQNHIGTELGNTKKIMANRKTIVDNQFNSLKKQSKCNIFKYKSYVFF
jgi:hypothetical protein